MDKYTQSIMDDYKQTIERLQKECKEKSDWICRLLDENETIVKEHDNELQKVEDQAYDRFERTLNLYKEDITRKRLALIESLKHKIKIARVTLKAIKRREKLCSNPNISVINLIEECIDAINIRGYNERC